MDPEVNVSNDDATLLSNDELDNVYTPPSNTQLDEENMILQSAVFIEDALQYKSIHHKTSVQSLKLYRWYFSRPVQACIQISVTMLLLVGFFETPSSLSYTSDPRRNPQRYINSNFQSTIFRKLYFIFLATLILQIKCF